MQAPSAVYHLSPPLMGSLSNVLPGTSHQELAIRSPTIQPTSPDKGASKHAFFPLPKGPAHAIAIASSASSTTESISELTSSSSSSRDSLPNPNPNPQARTGDSTPQKPARNNRRNKNNKSNARCSRGGGSSDDTGSERKPPNIQFLSKRAQSAVPSPQTASRQRQQSITTSTTSNNSSSSQARFMATAFGGPSGDSRRGVTSPRPKGRGMECHLHKTSCHV